ncbi:hypothetical protein J3A83DRAFT_3684267 [Scleroderma citrinum]
MIYQFGVRTHNICQGKFCVRANLWIYCKAWNNTKYKPLFGSDWGNSSLRRLWVNGWARLIARLERAVKRSSRLMILQMAVQETGHLRYTATGAPVFRAYISVFINDLGKSMRECAHTSTYDGSITCGSCFCTGKAGEPGGQRLRYWNENVDMFWGYYYRFQSTWRTGMNFKHKCDSEYLKLAWAISRRKTPDIRVTLSAIGLHFQPLGLLEFACWGDWATNG